MKIFILILSTLFIFGLSPIHEATASVVPSPKEQVHKKKKKRAFKKWKKKQFKKKQLKAEKKQLAAQLQGMFWGWWVLIGWGVIAVALFFIGLAIAFPPLWIAAIVLFCIPLALAIIFGIVFFILLVTSNGF